MTLPLPPHSAVCLESKAMSCESPNTGDPAFAGISGDTLKLTFCLV